MVESETDPAKKKRSKNKATEKYERLEGNFFSCSFVIIAGAIDRNINITIFVYVPV